MRSIRLAVFACFYSAMAGSAGLQLDLNGSDQAMLGNAEGQGTELQIRAGGGQGGTAIHWMAFNGDAAGISQLIVSGAEIDSRLKTGGTPLHLAAYRGHMAVVRLLVEHGANVNARTKAGVTPLDWARRNEQEEVAALLIAYGAKAGTGTGVPAPERPTAENEAGDGTASLVRKPVAKKLHRLELPKENVLVEKTPVAADVEAERPARTGDYRIQLGAFSSAQRATDAWARYQEAFPQFLGDRELLLDKADVKGKIYYRVQTGPMERSDAWEVCGELKKFGQSCAVMKRKPS